MRDVPDYYATLGVLPDSEDVVIRGAFRALMQKYHPDKFKGDPQFAERKAKQLNEAYSVLSDPEKRKAYDASRKKKADSSSQRNPGPQDSRKQQDDKSQNEPPKTHSTSTGTKQSHAWSSETAQRSAPSSSPTSGASVWVPIRFVILIFIALSVVRGLVTTSQRANSTYRPAIQDTAQATPSLRYRHASATIDSSLYLAAMREGVPANITVDMIRAFSPRVDFERDVERGDRFNLYFERYYAAEGRASRTGELIAAMITSGRRDQTFLSLATPAGPKSYIITGSYIERMFQYGTAEIWSLIARNCSAGGVADRDFSSCADRVWMKAQPPPDDWVPVGPTAQQPPDDLVAVCALPPTNGHCRERQGPIRTHARPHLCRHD